MIWKVVLLVLLFLNSAPPILAHDQPHIIKMSPGRFEPQEIQIDQADTVIFINEDTQDRWPASNIHPAHAIYPQFDPQRAIKPKEQWQFKFEKSGTFKFHDHLNPALTGTIEVKGGKVEENLTPFDLSLFIKKLYFKLFPDRLEREMAKEDFIKIGTDERAVKYWIFLIGGERFMQKLVADSEGGSKIDCHQEAHLTGRIASKFERRKVFKKPNYNCHSGYLHGAMEAFIAEIRGNLIKEVSGLCQGFDTEFSRFECLHGIGHGLTAYENYNLPEALKLCQQLPDDYAQSSCFGGVFMENIMVASGKGAIKGHSTNWVSDDPYFPCNRLDQDHQIEFQCYQMQTSRMLQLKGYDFAAIANMCKGVPDDMTGVCFTSMGRDLAGYVLRDPEKIVKSCKIAPGAYFNDCLRGALNVIIDFWGENLKDQPQGLCRILDGSEKEYCYTWFNSRLKNIFGKNTAKIKEACNYVEEEFKVSCTRAARS